MTLLFIASDHSWHMVQQNCYYKGWVNDFNHSSHRLLVGAPNTSASVSPGSPTIQGYGDVLKCASPETNNTICSSLNIREVAGSGRFAGKSLCGKYATY